MILGNHRTAIALVCATAATSLVLAAIGCSPPRDATAATTQKLEGERPSYLAEQAELYDKDRLQSIKNAGAGGAATAGRYAVTLTYADVGIPDGLETIDPAQFEPGPSSLANPAVILNLKSGERIVIELYADKSPGTVAHFIPIVQSGFYSGVYFQRSDDMCIQGGDPNVNGQESWPQTVQLEVNGLPFDVGSVGMARTSEVDSGSSQFYIIKSRAAHLDTEYANFGMVLEGMDSVMAVPSRDQANAEAPLDEDSRIVSAELVRFEGYEEAEQAILQAVNDAKTEESGNASAATEAETGS